MTTKEIPLYIRASIITSCVAFLFGLDTGTIGPVTTMKSFTETFGELSATIHGVVVSSILLPGALSALVAGILADRHGRTKIISVGSCIYGIGAAIEAGAPLLGVFILGRLIKGLGEGLFLSAVFVQVSEISPARIRGPMTSLPQFLIVLGLVAGYFICYGTARIQNSYHESTSLSWRLPLGLAAFLAFAFAATCSLVPPSPRWLLAKGRVEEARQIIAQLGLDEEEQQEMLAQSSSGLEQIQHNDTTFLKSLYAMFGEFREAFSAPFRSRTAFGCYIMGMQQFSGIDGVLYYAPILFQQAGLSGEQATFLASGVSALVILATTIPATLFADHWGRRTSSLLGGTLITFLMLLMGSLYAAGEVHADSGAGRWVVIVSIYLFAIVFNGTWAIGFRAFVVESMPRKTRSSASSLAQSANWIANYIVALTTPVLISRSTFGAYYFFAFCTLFTTIMIAIFMSETKGHSLEAIEQRYLEDRAGRTSGRWTSAERGFRLTRLRVTQG
ncbi:sugar transport protein [Diplogelasinospora grovesii]|uniref:Sugar transport protein n=1 Tax=Diplogelasinospora grovesii TaxID=303347 RepID=A0AAN6NJV2_9PEZI|nr:sugar transport protein [Diplogelasinospora grovesii]